MLYSNLSNKIMETPTLKRARALLKNASVLLMIALLPSCGMQGSDQPTNNTSSSVAPAEMVPVEKPPVSSLNGYKSFKFGMTKVEVVKLPECLKNFEALRNSERNTSSNTLERIDISIREAESNIRRLEEELTFHNVPERNRFLENGIRENQQKIAKYQEEKIALHEKDKSELEGFPEALVNAWVDTKDTYCIVDAMGETKKVAPIFGVNNQLVAINIVIGEFNNDKYQALVKALAEKYQPAYEPTPEQISDFNNLTVPELVSTFSGGQVALIVKNTKELKLLEPFSLEGAYQEDKRIMILSYMDTATAAEAGKRATKGRVNANDL